MLFLGGFFPLKICPIKTIWSSLWVFLVGPGLIDMSVPPGNALNALPRSSALSLSSTEWQQALTASLAQRNLRTMVPALGGMGPLKMDRSIYKNTLTSGCLC